MSVGAPFQDYTRGIYLNIYIYNKINIIYYCGGQLIPEVLFKLRGLGLWPNNPVREREHIRGQPIKEEMKIVLWEEVKYIYGGPNRIRGECSSRNFCPRWLETFSFP